MEIVGTATAEGAQGTVFAPAEASGVLGPQTDEGAPGVSTVQAGAEAPSSELPTWAKRVRIYGGSVLRAVAAFSRGGPVDAAVREAHLRGPGYDKYHGPRAI